MPYLIKLSSLRLHVALLLWLSGALACGEEGGASREALFNDHTHPRAERLEDFMRLSETDAGEIAAVKFHISGFREGEAQHTRLLESAFYELHDEVYWMRLLNGLTVWGVEHIDPVQGLSLPTVSEAYAWASRQEQLPLDLVFTRGGRLYSPLFYELAVSRPRRFIKGTVLLIRAREGRRRPEELWAYELGYTDEPSSAEIALLSARLRAALPPEASELMWLARSPQQEALAEEMRRAGVPEGDHTLRYYDLITPGEARVYSEGLSAGHLQVIRSGEEPSTSTEGSILIYDHVPDELPAAQGLITTVPQTPLAHVNLLAQNRGIPNLYVSGLSESTLIAQLEPLSPAVILWAKAPDEWRLEVMTRRELQAYQALQRPPERALSPVELSSQPLSYDLSQLSFAQALSLRGVIGGKAAGLVACMEAEGPTPYRPLVITGRAYEEHLSPWRAQLEALLEHPLFLRDERARRAALEGPLGLARGGGAGDQAWLEAQLAELQAEGGEGDALLWWVQRGGVQGLIRAAPIPQALLSELIGSLRAHFGALSPQQGLRFRSSSNVEDLEGFNGAGLYSSETGYLYPQALEGSARSKTVAWALREVWASYWSLGAFRERASEGVPHLEGHMSALVHPNFQDEEELANGVVLLSLTPPPPDQLHVGQRDSDEGGQLIATAQINTQAGALSVTNPARSGVLPEVIQVSLSTVEGQEEGLAWPYEGLARPYPEWLGRLEVKLERLQGSTEVGQVLSDEQAVEVAARALEVSARWLLLRRQRASAPRAPRALNLDLELRAVSARWPLSRGLPEEVGGGHERLILKQARPLESAGRGLSGALLELDAPRDLLLNARKIELISCVFERPQTSEEVKLSAHQLYTDPLARPSLGYERRPFTVDLSIEGWPERGAWRGTHEDLRFRGEREGAPWSLELGARLGNGAALPLAHLSLVASDEGLTEVQATWVERGSTRLESAPARCERELLYAEPSEYLRAILESRPPVE